MPDSGTRRDKKLYLAGGNNHFPSDPEPLPFSALT